MFTDSIVPQLIANSIIAGALYTLVALGFNLIYGVTKFFNLAHGVVAAVGGYIVFAFTKQLEWGAPVAVVLGIVGAAFISWLIDRVIYRPMRQRKSSQMVLLVGSLGVFTALQAVIAIIFTSQFQTLGGVSGEIKTFTWLGATITDIQAIIISSAVLITIGLAWYIKKSYFGKSVLAVSDDEQVAKVVGINTEKVIQRVFIIGGAIAGLAGILVGYDTGLEPTMGMNLLLKGVIASIIGGIGNVWGGFLGAFLLGFVENFGIWKISGEWKDAIAFGLLIIFLLVRPRGILRGSR